MKVLITGPDGQIGSQLLQRWPNSDHVVPVSIAQLDFTNSDAIRQTVRDIAPNLIVNAAGYTAVDRAETEPDIAMSINATAVGVLGEEAKRLGASVIHYSTDYVFDGRKSSPYTPDDTPNPQSVYAKSKYQGEVALRESGASHVVLRTSWIYGVYGRNFLLAILRQARLKPELRIVSDQTGCPTWCGEVANATIAIAQRGLRAFNSQVTFGELGGTYHVCSGGSTTWFEFAKRIIELAEIPNPPKLVPITTQEYAAPAARPLYSVMDCSKAHETFGVLIAEWSSALEELLRTQRAELANTLMQSGGS